MPDTTETRYEDDRPVSIWQRLGWFLALYLAGLVVVSLAAAGLRALIGLTLL
jgi:hypothetical protein